MPQNRAKTIKRAILILAALLLAAGGAFLGDWIIFRNITQYDRVSGETCVFSGAEAYDLNSCAILDGEYMVLGGDPHFTVYTYNAEFSRVRLEFRRPLPQNTALQLFYAPVGEGFSEANSLTRSVPAGLQEETLALPQGAYTSLRFDIEQDVGFRGIYIQGMEQTEAAGYAPHGVRIAVIFCAVLIPLCIPALRRRKK